MTDETEDDSFIIKDYDALKQAPKCERCGHERGGFTDSDRCSAHLPDHGGNRNVSIIQCRDRQIALMQARERALILKLEKWAQQLLELAEAEL